MADLRSAPSWRLVRSCIPAGGKEGAMSFLVRYGYEWMAWYRSVHATRTHYREHAESKLASLLVGAPVV